MKYCPKCHANVEGLIHHCVCCGALLNPKPSLFFCGVYEFPACYKFGDYSFQMLDEIEPSDLKKYSSFLKEIRVYMICVSDYMIITQNEKERVRYSPKKLEASMTLIVKYNDYVYADKTTKAKLVAEAIIRGLTMLNERLAKYYKLNIDTLLKDAKDILGKYL